MHSSISAASHSWRSAPERPDATERTPVSKAAIEAYQKIERGVRSRFHERPLRILVLDDEEPTRAELKQNLSVCFPGTRSSEGSLYSTGSYMQALDELVEASRLGKPYQVLVLDVFLGPDQAGGLDFLRELQSRFARLGRPGDLPAVTINTSSMLSRHVLSLQHAQLARSLAELARCSEEHAFPPMLPDCPISFHHKTGGTAGSLLTAIDIALLRRENNPPALAAFLEAYKPLVLDHSVEEEVTHLASERVMATARVLSGIFERAVLCGVELTRPLCTLTESGEILAELENFSYTLARQRVLELADRREMHTTEALAVVLHQVANRFERLKVEEGAQDYMREDPAKAWNASLGALQKRIRELTQELDADSDRSWDIVSHLSRIIKKPGMLVTFEGPKTLHIGKNPTVKSVLTEAANAFRELKGQEAIAVDVIPPGRVNGCKSLSFRQQQKLGERGIENCVVVNFEFPAAKEMPDLNPAVAFQASLGAFQRSGKGLFFLEDDPPRVKIVIRAEVEAAEAPMKPAAASASLKRESPVCRQVTIAGEHLEVSDYGNLIVAAPVPVPQLDSDMSGTLRLHKGIWHLVFMDAFHASCAMACQSLACSEAANERSFSVQLRPDRKLEDVESLLLKLGLICDDSVADLQCLAVDLWKVSTRRGLGYDLSFSDSRDGTRLRVTETTGGTGIRNDIEFTLQDLEKTESGLTIEIDMMRAFVNASYRLKVKNRGGKNMFYVALPEAHPYAPIVRSLLSQAGCRNEDLEFNVDQFMDRVPI